MTDKQHELEELRRSLADDETKRQRLLAGLGQELEARDADVAGVIESHALLYSPPAIASRAVLAGQMAGSPPQESAASVVSNP